MGEYIWGSVSVIEEYPKNKKVFKYYIKNNINLYWFIGLEEKYFFKITTKMPTIVMPFIFVYSEKQQLCV